MKEVTLVAIRTSFLWLPSGLSAVPIVSDFIGGPMYCVSRLSCSNSSSESELLSSVGSCLTNGLGGDQLVGGYRLFSVQQ